MKEVSPIVKKFFEDFERGSNTFESDLLASQYENYARAWLVTWKTINQLSCFQRKQRPTQNRTRSKVQNSPLLSSGHGQSGDGDGGGV